jgi:hypothetical protein
MYVKGLFNDSYFQQHPFLSFFPWLPFSWLPFLLSEGCKVLGPWV